jgi:hypothetical protein
MAVKYNTLKQVSIENIENIEKERWGCHKAEPVLYNYVRGSALGFAVTSREGSEGHPGMKTPQDSPKAYKLIMHCINLESFSKSS